MTEFWPRHKTSRRQFHQASSAGLRSCARYTQRALQSLMTMPHMFRLVQNLLLAFFLISLSQCTRQDEADPTAHQRRIVPTLYEQCEIGAKRPNIILIITDDQDLHMDSLKYMPNVRKHIIDEGTSYRRHFCTTALCCPSRVTLLVYIPRCSEVYASFLQTLTRF